MLKDGEQFLLIVDPNTPRRQMEKIQSNNTNSLGFIRKSLHNMKSDQYQIATVVGIITSEEEYQVCDFFYHSLFVSSFLTSILFQASKAMRSVKIH